MIFCCKNFELLIQAGYYQLQKKGDFPGIREDSFLINFVSPDGQEAGCGINYCPHCGSNIKDPNQILKLEIQCLSQDTIEIIKSDPELNKQFKDKLPNENLMELVIEKDNFILIYNNQVIAIEKDKRELIFRYPNQAKLGTVYKLPKRMSVKNVISLVNN